MKKNLRKMFINTSIITAGVLPLSLVAQIFVVKNNNEINKNNLETNNFNLQTNTKQSFISENSSLEVISSNIGPIVIDSTNQTKVINYDWYYNPAWELDVSEPKFGSSTGIADWQYLPDHDFLFLITDKSVLIKIQASTGKVLASALQQDSQIPVASNKIAKIDFNSTLYVWNSRETNKEVVAIDVNTLKKTNNTIGNQKSSTIDLLGLDVGYNLAITTTNAITDSNSPITNLTLKFVDDSLNDFPSNNTNKVPSVDLTITSVSYNNIHRNLFKRNSTTFILVISNKIYEINLNKQDMTLSTITEKNNGNSTITLKPINSSYMSANGSIFLKSNDDAKIYRIASNTTSLATYIDLATVPTSTNTTLSAAASATNNTIRIYPVPDSPDVNSSLYLDNSVFVIDPKTKVSTGINNGAALYDFQTTKPDIIIPANSNATFLSKIPSSVSSRDFSSQNADPLASTNVSLEADDLSGILKGKFKLTKTAWYSTAKKTISIINKSFTVSKVYSKDPNNSKFNFVLQSTFQNIDNNYFSKKAPSQISSTDFDLYGQTVLPLSSSVQSSFFKNLKRTFIITSRVDSTGEIKVKAIVSYTNVYNNYVSFVVDETSYIVTKTTASSYAFKFIPNDSPKLNALKQTLPSLINNTNTSLLETFIEQEVLYPPSRRNIFLKGDDISGTVKVVVTYNGLEPGVDSFFEQTFSGFITEAQATITFNGSLVNASTKPNLASVFPNAKDITTIVGYANYDQKIVNQINTDELTLTYDFGQLAKMGFVPKISILPFKPVQLEYGALTIELNFDPNQTVGTKKLPSIYKDKFGLKDYKITQEYVGFLSVGVLYTIGLKNYDSPSVQNLVSTVPIGSVVAKSKLLDTLNLKGYTLNEVHLTNYVWKNESIVFEVIAQSNQYPTINKRVTFTIDWAPFFQSSRTTNLIIAVAVALLGTTLVAAAIAFYIYRKNKIRRMLK